jgi:hypothetical protein
VGGETEEWLFWFAEGDVYRSVFLYVCEILSLWAKMTMYLEFGVFERNGC